MKGGGQSGNRPVTNWQENVAFGFESEQVGSASKADVLKSNTLV